MRGQFAAVSIVEEDNINNQKREEKLEYTEELFLQDLFDVFMANNMSIGKWELCMCTKKITGPFLVYASLIYCVNRNNNLHSCVRKAMKCIY